MDLGDVEANPGTSSEDLTLDSLHVSMRTP
jgi:hypothetical protein